jgi:hypothetical protein
VLSWTLVEQFIFSSVVPTAVCRAKVVPQCVLIVELFPPLALRVDASGTSERSWWPLAKEAESTAHEK